MIGPDEQATPWPKVEDLAHTLTTCVSRDFHSRWPQAPLQSEAFELFFHGFLQGLLLTGAIASKDDMEWWYERTMKRIFGRENPQ